MTTDSNQTKFANETHAKLLPLHIDFMSLQKKQSSIENIFKSQSGKQVKNTLAI